MSTTRRSIQVGMLSLLVIGAAACYDESITGAATHGKSTAAFAPVVVFFQDFSAGTGAGGAFSAVWSANAVTTTAPSSEKFLGEFGNDSVRLSLSGFGVHTEITVSFDVYLIRSWDGVDATWGTDSLVVNTDGVFLGCTTFANNSDEQQNYNGGIGNAASQCGSGTTTAFQTGATGVNTLGYLWYPPDADPQDAKYNIAFLIPHTISTFSIDFIGKNLQSLADESWGIDNLFVQIGP